MHSKGSKKTQKKSRKTHQQGVCDLMRLLLDCRPAEEKQWTDRVLQGTKDQGKETNDKSIFWRPTFISRDGTRLLQDGYNNNSCGCNDRTTNNRVQVGSDVQTKDDCPVRCLVYSRRRQIKGNSVMNKCRKANPVGILRRV